MRHFVSRFAACALLCGVSGFAIAATPIQDALSRAIGPQTWVYGLADFLNVNFATPAGTYANGSVALSTAPLDIWAANSARVRALLLNNSGIGTSGGAPIVEWCRWGTVAASPAAVAGVGSFALQPGGGGRDDTGAGVNQGPLNCLAESGTPSLYAEQY